MWPVLGNNSGAARWPALAWSVLRIGLASYVGLCLLVFLRQSRYVYNPAAELLLTPASVKLPYEEVALRTGDGETVRAWFVPATPARATLLYCHGNAGNRGDRVEPMQFFHDLGLNVLMLDYRGYGGSSGRPTETGTYLDAQAAWDFLTATRGIPAREIVVFGRSLGGAVAAWLAERHPPGALILEDTFTSLPDMAAQFYPYLPVRWLCRFRYNTLARLPHIRCPVLVVHSAADEMIPFDQGQRLFAAAREPKRFLQTAGSHNIEVGDLGPAYREGLDRFLKDYAVEAAHAAQ